MKIFAVLIIFCVVHINNTHASLLNWDAFVSGDGKAVKDDSTGLVWLALDVIAGIDYYQAGDYFDGWEYADSQDVHNLLNSSFPDLTYSGTLGLKYNYEQNCVNTSTCYADAKMWQTLFGSVAGIDRLYQTRSLGLYSDDNGVLRLGGSYLNGTGSANIYGSGFNVDYSTGLNETQKIYFSTFLIRSDSKPSVQNSDVSAPAYSLLFILFGLFLVKRKVTHQ